MYVEIYLYAGKLIKVDRKDVGLKMVQYSDHNRLQVACNDLIFKQSQVKWDDL